MGDGFRTFQSGEVLTSSNVQNYLMDQSVMVFAGTAARSSAIASPETGMLTYRTDGTADAKRQGFEFYDGSAYVRLINPSGLELISENTFSGVASFSLPNDTFTTTYDNYRLEIRITALSGTGTMRLRTSGTDNSNNTYKYSVGFAGTYTSGTFSAAGSGNATSFELMMEDAASPYSWQGSMDVMSPKLPDRTAIHCLCANITKGRLYTGIFDNTTAFDSLTVLATSITGTIRVYGYRNS